MSWFAVGSAVVGGYLSYKGAKQNAAQAQANRDQSYLQTQEGREWQGYQAELQRGFSQAQTEIQRADTASQLQYNIEQEQAKYDKWTEEFGDLRDNINSYYKDLTVDSVVGEAHHNLEQSYQLALTQIQNKYAERGITPKSGFYNASEFALDISKAQQSAQIRSGAERNVIEQQSQYIAQQQNDRFLTRPTDFKFENRNDILANSVSDNVKNEGQLLQDKYNKGLISAEDVQKQLSEKFGEQGLTYWNATGVGNSQDRDYTTQVQNKINSTETGTVDNYNVKYGYRYKNGTNIDNVLSNYKQDNTYDFNNDLERYEISRVRMEDECCFLPDQKVLMSDGKLKAIKDVKVGDKVKGAFGFDNEVISLNRPLLGNRKLYKLNNLITTEEHPLVNGDENGFVSMDINKTMAERGLSKTTNYKGEEIEHYYHCINDKDTKLENIVLDKTSILTLNGKEVINTKKVLDYKKDTQLYSLTTTNSHTFNVDGYYVGGGANDYDFDYNLGIIKEGKITDSYKEYLEFKKVSNG